jgi:hypothetical protein
VRGAYSPVKATQYFQFSGLLAGLRPFRTGLSAPGHGQPKVDHTSCYVISKLFTQTPFLIGRGDATFLHVSYVGKLTCVHGRFKDPFLLWLIQILKAVTTIMVYGDYIFGSFLRNAQPSHATARIPGSPSDRWALDAHTHTCHAARSPRTIHRKRDLLGSNSTGARRSQSREGA